MTQNSLQGVTVALARAGRPVSVLRADLVRRGATVLDVPSMTVRAIEDWEPGVFAESAPDWTVVTTKNAAERVARVVRMGRGTHGQLGRVAASGSVTARYLEKYGLWPQCASDTQDLHALTEALVTRGVQGKTVVVACSDALPTAFISSLEAAGADVRPVVVYRVELSEGADGRAVFEGERTPDMVVFPALQTTQDFASLLREWGADTWFELPAAAIGPATARSAQERGFHVVVTPERHTMGALADAIEDWHANSVS